MFLEIVTSLAAAISVVLAADSALPNAADKPAVSFVSYKDAYRRAQEEHLPLVVFVGAEWCPACRKMEETVIPSLPKSPILRNGVFARVDYDQDTKLARAITGGGALPQVVIFPPQGSGGKLRRVIGAQPVERLFRFLQDGLSVKRDPAEATAMGGVPGRAS
ncbi:MAG: thioredoxin family protein [Thermogutta sp.]|nr:thioredoxin family protein [Thermogutta sp.]